MKKEYVFSLNEIRVIANILGYNWIFGLWDPYQLIAVPLINRTEINELEKGKIIQIPFNGEIYVDDNVRHLFDVVCNPLKIKTCCKNNEPEYTAYCDDQLIVIAKRIGYSKYSFKCCDADCDIFNRDLFCNTSLDCFLEINICLIQQWLDLITNFDVIGVKQIVNQTYHRYADLIFSFIMEDLDTYIIHFYDRMNGYYKDESCFSFVEYKDSFFQIVQNGDDSLAFYIVNADFNEVLYGECSSYDNGFIK